MWPYPDSGTFYRNIFTKPLARMISLSRLVVQIQLREHGISKSRIQEDFGLIGAQILFFSYLLGEREGSRASSSGGSLDKWFDRKWVLGIRVKYCFHDYSTVFYEVPYENLAFNT